MKELLNFRNGKSVAVLVTGVSFLSSASTIVINAQTAEVSRAVPEVGWWALTLGGVALVLSSMTFLLLVFTRGQRLLENDRLARWLYYTTAAVVISAGLTASGWLIVKVGLLPWAVAESAILVHLVILPLLIWSIRGQRQQVTQK